MQRIAQPVRLLYMAGRQGVLWRRIVAVLLGALLVSALPLPPARAAGQCSSADDNHCERWISRYDSGLNETSDGAYPEKPHDSVVSRDGKTLYITGQTFQGGTLSLIVTMAFSTSGGRLLWSRQYFKRVSDGSRPYNVGTGITLSPDGSTVFVTGQQAADGGGRGDVVLLAYRAADGHPEWRAGGFKGRAYPEDVSVSSDGTLVFVAGGVERKGHRRDAFLTAYLASNGKKLWSRVYDGKKHGWDTSSDVDARSNVVVVSGQTHHTASNRSEIRFFTTAYRISHDRPRLLWRRLWDAGERGFADGPHLAISNDGRRVFALGSHQARPDSGTYVQRTAIIRFDMNGSERWSQLETAAGSGWFSSVHLALDETDGMVIAAGLGDPLAASESGFGYFETKAYSIASGGALWTEIYRPPSGGAYATGAIAHGDDHSVYVTGVVLKAIGRDMLTLRYDARDGTPLWAARYNQSDGPGDTEAFADTSAVSRGGRIFVAGELDGSGQVETGSGYDKIDIGVVAYDP